VGRNKIDSVSSEGCILLNKYVLQQFLLKRLSIL